MKGNLIRGVVVAAWMAAMFWLVRYEAFPGWFTRTLGGYAEMMADGAVFEDRWMKIAWGGRPIGYSHLQIEVADHNAFEYYKLANATELQFNMLGEVQRVSLSASSSLDALYALQRFSFALHARHYSMSVEGRRAGGDRFDVDIRTPGNRQQTRLEVPPDVVIYSPMIDAALSRMRPGETKRMRTLDPASMAVADILVRAEGRETLTVGGRPVEALRLAVEYQGATMRSWVDGEGHALRHETPFGWTLEACTAEEALALDFDAAGGGDMLALAAVPCVPPIRNPAASAITFRLCDTPLAPADLRTPRQEVLAASGRVVTVRASRQAWPDADDGAAAADLAPFLAATPFVQAGHPALVRRAAEITRGLDDPAAKARALYRWVYRSVRKVPAVSLPSAVDVLEQMEGDCNEHTYLFVALARAAGIPAAIRIGLYYKEGRFYYHAWPSVHIRGWVDMDPTLGQETVGATHLSLLEGELGNQVRLLGVINRLRVEVVEEGPE